MKEKNLLSRILQNISCPAGILGTDDVVEEMRMEVTRLIQQYD